MTSEASIPKRPTRRRWRPILLVFALILVGVGGWLVWQRPSGPAIPAIQLDGSDPEVAARVQKAHEAVRENPRSASGWGRLGMTLLANKFEEESVAPFRIAEELDPANPRWPYLRGIALLGRNPDEALPFLRRAAENSGDSEQRAVALLRLAETLAANGHNEDAEAQFREVPPGPLSPCADYGLGVLAAVRGDLVESKRYLIRCTDSPFTRQKATAQLAVLARRSGEKEGIRAGPLPADAPWPDPFLEACMAYVAGKESRMQRVTTLEQQGRVNEAMNELRAIARDYPDSLTYLTLGITLGRAGQYQESEDYLRKCLEKEPRLVRAQYYLSLALFARGEALKHQGRQSESVTQFEAAAMWARQAAELAPHNGEAHFQLGLTEWCLDHRAEAIRAFRQTVATRPELADGHLWLGKALAADGQKEEALLHLRHAIRYADPNDPRPRQALEHLVKEKKP